MSFVYAALSVLLIISAAVFMTTTSILVDRMTYSLPIDLSASLLTHVIHIALHERSEGVHSSLGFSLT
jgi:hypothetical protein